MSVPLQSSESSLGDPFECSVVALAESVGLLKATSADMTGRPLPSPSHDGASTLSLEVNHIIMVYRSRRW